MYKNLFCNLLWIAYTADFPFLRAKAATAFSAS